MAVERWNEVGKIWDEDHGLLEAEQIAKCVRADQAEPFRSPVPTQMVSNGEYMPEPQTDKQKSVQQHIEELANAASNQLGVDRRKFLASSGGLAAAFLAMNEVFGPHFNVCADETTDADARAKNAAPRDLFVLDDQLHFVRGSRSAAGLRAIAKGPSSAPQFKTNPLTGKANSTSTAQHGVFGTRHSSDCQSNLSVFIWCSSSKTSFSIAKLRLAC